MIAYIQYLNNGNLPTGFRVEVGEGNGSVSVPSGFQWGKQHPKTTIYCR